ncbi:MAG: hypothetical protein II876_08060 [Synergistaceae bacterium]|nr:hypothetical protein [Synergistaceae bacterium]
MKKPELDSELMARLFPATLGAKKAAREKAEQKAEEIMRRAVKDPVLLDEIQERACIRWSEGLSDSLYLAVLGNLIDTEEEIEYSDEPDMEVVEFKRRLGIPEAAIMDSERSPSVWIKLKPKTDWEAELEKYR